MKKWLDPTLILLVALLYSLALTGDYFLPKIAVPIVLGFLVTLSLLRLYLKYRPPLPAFLPYALALLITLVAAFLRFQTLKNIVPTANLATDAITILRQSNWQPSNFEQPSLYLYFASALAGLQLVQQASAGKISSPDGLEPATLTTLLAYSNLLLALITLLPTYLVAKELYKSHPAALFATTLLATSWLAYAPTPLITPQFLAALLLITSFYFILKASNLRDMLYSGILAGLALSTAYGSISLLLTCLIAIHTTTLPKLKATLLLSGGWLLGFTLGMPSWIFSFNKFLAGLALTNAAPPNTTRFYFQQALTNDAGLVLMFGLAIILALYVPASKLILSLPITYFLILSLIGEPKIERIALVMPFVAIAAVAPLVYYKKVAGWNALIALILIIVVSFVIRRIL